MLRGLFRALLAISILGSHRLGGARALLRPAGLGRGSGRGRSGRPAGRVRGGPTARELVAGGPVRGGLRRLPVRLERRRALQSSKLAARRRQAALRQFDGDLVTIHNIRNFDYQTEAEYTPHYYDKTFDLRELDSVDLISVYWMGDAIAHIMLSFGFAGRDYVTVSIETRKEVGESYDTIRGFFRQYELIYIVGDERDLIRLRTNYRKDPPEDVYVLPHRRAEARTRGVCSSTTSARSTSFGTTRPGTTRSRPTAPPTCCGTPR